MSQTGCGAVWGWLAILLAAVPVSAATHLKARLLTPVSSYHSKAGDSIEALVVPPACPEPLHAFPAGTIVYGRVGKVHRVGLGIAHETARMTLEFTGLR